MQQYDDHYPASDGTGTAPHCSESERAIGASELPAGLDGLFPEDAVEPRGPTIPHLKRRLTVGIRHHVVVQRSLEAIRDKQSNIARTDELARTLASAALEEPIETDYEAPRFAAVARRAAAGHLDKYAPHALELVADELDKLKVGITMLHALDLIGYSTDPKWRNLPAGPLAQSITYLAWQIRLQSLPTAGGR